MKEPHGKHQPDDVKTTGGCPDDPQEVCTEFMEKSVMEWEIWVAQATARFYSCCGEYGPAAPTPTRLKCSEMDDDCKQLCRAASSWALGLAHWARDFEKDVIDCIPDWKPSAKIPPNLTGSCRNCGEACTAIQEFHKGLVTWGEDVRTALNDICTAPPGKVPPPPPPPFGS
jgi:hypothetical protein